MADWNLLILMRVLKLNLWACMRDGWLGRNSISRSKGCSPKPKSLSGWCETRILGQSRIFEILWSLSSEWIPSKATKVLPWVCVNLAFLVTSNCHTPTTFKWAKSCDSGQASLETWVSRFTFFCLWSPPRLPNNLIWLRVPVSGGTDVFWLTWWSAPRLARWHKAY